MACSSISVSPSPLFLPSSQVLRFPFSYFLLFSFPAASCSYCPDFPVTLSSSGPSAASLFVLFCFWFPLPNPFPRFSLFTQPKPPLPFFQIFLVPFLPIAGHPQPSLSCGSLFLQNFSVQPLFPLVCSPNLSFALPILLPFSRHILSSLVFLFLAVPKPL